MCLCDEFACMQVAIKRACAHPEAKQVVLTQHADAVMEALLKVQNSRSSVSEEVVMAMSVLCLEQGTDFSRYLQHIMPTILAGLSRHEDLEVCRICVNTVGDIAREVLEHVLPYADPCGPTYTCIPNPQCQTADVTAFRLHSGCIQQCQAGMPVSHNPGRPFSIRFRA